MLAAAAAAAGAADDKDGSSHRGAVQQNMQARSPFFLRCC
jgi:hypothetical protein